MVILKFRSNSWFVNTFLTKVKLHRSFPWRFCTSNPKLNRCCSTDSRSILHLLKHTLNTQVFPSNLTFYRNAMDLASVVKIIEEIIPPELAEEWDNTGLLIGPHPTTKISVVLLTNDLTEAVLKEARDLKADLILSYHPPIFSSIKLFQSKNWKDRVIMGCIANQIAVYSPHTACDAVEGGVNDWLLSCFETRERSPIKKAFTPVETNMIEFFAPLNFDLKNVLQDFEYQVVLRNRDLAVMQRFKLVASSKDTPGISQLLEKQPDVRPIVVQECQPSHVQRNGMGRLATLLAPVQLKKCLELVKNHVGLKHVRFSLGVGHTLDMEVSKVAVCAGSGGSVLKNVSAQLYVTGEMSHHDLLDAAHNGISVILCEHSNSERGYLKGLAISLSLKLTGVTLAVSNSDRDPITIV